MGSILSCTDIFSFIQRLRKHGTPQKIISLIEGESLINYCICVLIFQIINVFCYINLGTGSNGQTKYVIPVIVSTFHLRDYRRYIVWTILCRDSFVLPEKNYL